MMMNFVRLLNLIVMLLRISNSGILVKIEPHALLNEKRENIFTDQQLMEKFQVGNNPKAGFLLLKRGKTQILAKL